MTKLSILGLCAVFALAACGGGEKAATDKPADSTTTSTAPATTEQPKQAAIQHWTKKLMQVWHKSKANCQ